MYWYVKLRPPQPLVFPKKSGQWLDKQCPREEHRPMKQSGKALAIILLETSLRGGKE
jgi:hypothetical protein